MRQPQRVYRDTGRAPAEDDGDGAAPLDERSVLGLLESGRAEDDARYEPLIGIRNGLLIGLGFWAVVLALVGLIAGLGYL